MSDPGVSGTGPLVSRLSEENTKSNFIAKLHAVQKYTYRLYVSTANIKEIMKFHYLGHKTSERLWYHDR